MLAWYSASLFLTLLIVILPGLTETEEAKKIKDAIRIQKSHIFELEKLSIELHKQICEKLTTNRDHPINNDDEDFCVNKITKVADEQLQTGKDQNPSRENHLNAKNVKNKVVLDKSSKLDMVLNIQKNNSDIKLSINAVTPSNQARHQSSKNTTRSSILDKDKVDLFLKVKKQVSDLYVSQSELEKRLEGKQFKLPLLDLNLEDKAIIALWPVCCCGLSITAIFFRMRVLESYKNYHFKPSVNDPPFWAYPLSIHFTNAVDNNSFIKWLSSNIAALSYHSIFIFMAFKFLFTTSIVEIVTIDKPSFAINSLVLFITILSLIFPLASSILEDFKKTVK
ncbi:hypothetical protein ACH5Y9_09310 [Methylomonas sp. BW4-1]|uniref:hypothetical protein n=1 Tax=Methylomonas sp. BW4-1 TaxID=3376685 RepID=UPI00404357E1